MRRTDPTARRPFGGTWWGRAWLTALEDVAGLDSTRLARGKAYARGGRIRAIEVAPGEVRAYVRGSRFEPYRVSIVWPALTDEQWERLLDVVSTKVGHVAALLDGDLPTDLVADLAAAGLSLLPGPGDLDPSCSCPDEAVPCKHAAAVCYEVSDLLDNDPFELLLLRGRSRDEVLNALRARRSGITDEPATTGATGSPERLARNAPSTSSRDRPRSSSSSNGSLSSRSATA